MGICGGIAALTALCGVSQAQITFTSGGSLTAWNGSPTYTSLANSALGGATTGQGNPTITGSFGVLSETFTPTSSFTLASFNILIGVNNVTSPTYTINLYNLGPAGTVSVSASGASYNPSASSPATISLAFSDTVTFSGGSAGAVQGAFTLAGADQVALSANEQYALEILTPSADGNAGVTWFRGSTADPGGQMFSGADGNGIRNTLVGNGQAGGAPRTGALALYAAPEPGAFVFLGLGGALSLLVIRRRRS